LHHVAVPGKPVHLSLPGMGIRPDCCLDRYVFRLDAARDHFLHPFPLPEMVKSSRH